MPLNIKIKNSFKMLPFKTYIHTYVHTSNDFFQIFYNFRNHENFETRNLEISGHYFN